MVHRDVVGCPVSRARLILGLSTVNSGAFSWCLTLSHLCLMLLGTENCGKPTYLLSFSYFYNQSRAKTNDRRYQL